MKRRILAGFLLVLILILVGITLAGVLEVVTKVQFNMENADFKNVSGTILNMSETIPNGGIDYITNVSFMWQLTSNHSYMGNKTVSNVSCGLADCANLSVFNTSFDTTTLPDGLYNISLMLVNVSVDNPTNTIILYNYSAAINVIVDNTVPRVTTFLPASGGMYTITTGNVSFTASVIDAYLASTNGSAAAGVANVFFYFDNASNAPSGLGFNATATNWSGIWNVSYNVSMLNPGVHIVKVIANDSAGNINKTISMAFTVNTPPVVTIVSPTSGQNYSIASSNQTFNITITGNVSLMGTVYLMFNNATGAPYFNVSAALDERGQQWNISYNVSTLHGGAHTVTVFANDTLGNWNNTVSTTFTVNTPPAVTIVSPTSGQNYSIASSNQAFNITITGNVSLMGTVYLMFNNATGAYFNVSAALDERGQQWNVSYNVSTLHGGSHTVTVFANDTLGNWNNTVSTTFTVNTPFNVAIVAPTGAQNYSLSKDNVTFNITILGNTTPLDTIYLMFDNATGNDFNRTMTNSSGKWWVSYNVSSLVEGINTVRVFANDTIIGNWNNTVSVTFSTDYTAPSVTLTRSSSSTSSQLVLDIATSGDVLYCEEIRGYFTSWSGTGASQTLTYTGLSAAKSVAFTVNCYDEAANTGGRSESFTTDSETGTGSGGTGSGGGSSAGIAGKFGKKIWTSINAGETATVEVANGELGVTDVSFKITETVWGAWLKVAKVDTLPSTAGSIEGKVYKNLQVTKGPALKDELIKDAKMDFKVEKTWLTSNNIDTQNVALFHYDGAKWNALETTMASQDALYAYYSASVPGFSYFVIGEKTAAEVPAAEEAAAEAPAEVTGEAAAGEAEAGAAEEAETNWGLVLLIVLAVFVVIVLVAVYLKKKR